jgi:hypothetical protein
MGACKFRVDQTGARGLDRRLLASLTLQPIGYLRTRQQVKFQAGHQPEAASEERNELELLAGHGYEQALQDLAGMERVWLLWSGCSGGFIATTTGARACCRPADRRRDAGCLQRARRIVPARSG